MFNGGLVPGADPHDDFEGPDIVPRTFRLGERISRLCRYLEDNHKQERDLARQLRRSGRAIGALVEEAQGGESKKDFIHKMSIAYKEARETHYWLRQLAKAELVPAKRLDSLVDEARQVKLILAAILRSARRKGD